MSQLRARPRPAIRYDVLALIAMTGLIWSLLAPATKLLFGAEGGSVFDPLSLATARAVWCIPLYVLLLGMMWRLERAAPTAGDIAAFAALGLLSWPGLNLIFAIAAAHTSVAHIVFVGGLSPPATAALEAIVFRTRLDWTRRIAIGLGVLGVTLLALARSGGASTLFGDALMLLWLTLFAAFALITRRLLVRYRPPFIVAMTGALGTIVLAVLGIGLGAGRAIARTADSTAIGIEFFIEIVVGASFVAQITYAQAIRRSNIAVATSGSHYLTIALGIVFSIVMLHERWQPLTLLAGSLMIASLALTFAPSRSASPGVR